MSGQVSSILELLADAVDGLDLPSDGAALAEPFRFADRLNAKLLAAVGEHDAAELWRNDGATSMTAWLRHHTGHGGRDAGRCTKTARRLRVLPVTAGAYRDGALRRPDPGHHRQPSGSQRRPVRRPRVRTRSRTGEAVSGRRRRRHAGRARRADALLGDECDRAGSERSLHLSRILDGRRELSGSFDPEGGAVIATALRLAATPDVEGEPARSPTQRRADALVDVCRHFLDHQQQRRGGRHRPHLNVITTLADLQRQGHGRLVEGATLDAATLGRLACDTGIHRVITDGRASILDYGTTTRTVPANLYNALVIRDRHCRYPGCDRPPDWTEAHHVHWTAHGGPTALDNLVLVRTHHHLLHAPDWHAKLLPDPASKSPTPTVAPTPAPHPIPDDHHHSP